MSANSLSVLWESRGFVPDRLLFLTYVFNFRDFHDQVLRRLLENARGRSLRVDVLTTCVDAEEESDCFDYRYLARLRSRFRLFRCDARPLAHAKAIIACDSSTGRTVSGFGSSNLTPGGWRHNVELWRWDGGRSAAAALAMCEALERRNGLKSGLTSEWRGLFKSPSPDRSVVVLGMPSPPSFDTLFERAIRLIGRPKVVRVGSPYFDAGSPDLFDRIARRLQGCRLEIWSDRSGRLSEPTHWRIVSDVIPRLRKQFADVRVVAPEIASWHAKVLELDDEHRRVARIFGSANFTGAAWGTRKPGNLELVGIDQGRVALPELLAARDIKITPVSAQERDRLISREEADQIARSRGPALLWACLTETPRVEITARLAAAERVTWWVVDAGFDETRPEEEKARLRGIRDRVAHRGHWLMRQSGRQLNLEWVGGEFIACERMTLKIKTGSGATSAPIWIPEPDWSARDDKTGVPIDEWSVDAFVRGPRPIVALRRKHRDPEYDEEVAEELNIAADENLAIQHPDYDHEPELLRLARRLRESPDTISVMKRRLETIARKGSLRDQLLARAALRLGVRKDP
jgi:hypothetical protein